MKEKYSDQLVFDYINALDLGNYDIDELENDPKFMAKVMTLSKDKEMYNLCGDNVKNDYNFIRNLVLEYKNDPEFTNRVSAEYLSNHDDDSCVELNIIMSNFHYEDNDDNLDFRPVLKYNIAKQSFISSFTYELKALYQRDKKAEEDFGLGFMLAYEMYAGYPYIIDELAKNYFLEEIFYDKEEKYTFEKLIHKNIKNVNTIREPGIINFLIEYIKMYDESLSWYVSSNLFLLSDIKKSLIRTDKNWENYMYEINVRKTFIFQKELNDYFVDNFPEDFSPSFDISELIIYEIEKHKLEYIFARYSDYTELKNYVDCYNKENNIESINEKKCSLIDLKYLKYADKLIEDLFKDDVIEANPELEQNNRIQETKTRILKLNFNKEK